jgi:uncharacterized paraquat-inducible protein A
MASDVLCGRCGTLLTNPGAPCPRCGAPASGRWQQPYARPASRKDPKIAALLALIPGCGHFYLGHNLKGVALLIGIGGFQLVDLGFDVTGIGAFVGIPLELGPAGLWMYSIVDAYRTAKQMERERGF